MIKVTCSGKDIPFKVMKFPCGETGVQIDQKVVLNQEVGAQRHDPYHITIDLRYESDQDLVTLILLVDALRRFHTESYLVQRPKSITLLIPYFPYSRQDRVCNTGESFSLKAIANVINSLHFTNVQVMDPHSTVLEGVIDNLIVVHPKTFVGDIVWKMNTGYLVAPDNGATKKVLECAKYSSAKFIQASKIRDTTDGKLSGCEVHCEDLGQASVLVVDDICDGGGTFIPLLTKLREKTKGKVYLYVTHGFFTKGLEPLKGYDGIFTANLMNPKLEIYHGVVRERQTSTSNA